MRLVKGRRRPDLEARTSTEAPANVTSARLPLRRTVMTPIRSTTTFVRLRPVCLEVESQDNALMRDRDRRPAPVDPSTTVEFDGADLPRSSRCERRPDRNHHPRFLSCHFPLVDSSRSEANDSVPGRWSCRRDSRGRSRLRVQRLLANRSAMAIAKFAGHRPWRYASWWSGRCWRTPLVVGWRVPRRWQPRQRDDLRAHVRRQR
jgi:hypothetical protein